jgi:hypothetical protein
MKGKAFSFFTFIYICKVKVLEFVSRSNYKQRRALSSYCILIVVLRKRNVALGRRTFTSKVSKHVSISRFSSLYSLNAFFPSRTATASLFSRSLKVEKCTRLEANRK